MWSAGSCLLGPSFTRGTKSFFVLLPLLFPVRSNIFNTYVVTLFVNLLNQIGILLLIKVVWTSYVLEKTVTLIVEVTDASVPLTNIFRFVSKMTQLNTANLALDCILENAQLLTHGLKFTWHLKFVDKNLKHHLFVNLRVVQNLRDELLAVSFLVCHIILTVLTVKDSHLLTDHLIVRFTCLFVWKWGRWNI